MVPWGLFNEAKLYMHTISKSQWIFVVNLALDVFLWEAEHGSHALSTIMH